MRGLLIQRSDGIASFPTRDRLARDFVADEGADDEGAGLAAEDHHSTYGIEIRHMKIERRSIEIGI